MNMNKDNKLVYAGLGVRFMAGAIDWVIIIFLSFFVIRMFNLAGMEMSIYDKNNEKVSILSLAELITKEDPESNELEKLTIKEIFNQTHYRFDPKTQRNLNFIFLFVSMVYSVYFVSSKKQGTPGKQLLKIMVIDKKCGRMSVLNSFIRYVAQRITNLLFFIGYLPILFTKEKVALHDFLANTRVVYIKVEEKNER
jgi:uncharacterized RDD family membrane protein YckC